MRTLSSVSFVVLSAALVGCGGNNSSSGESRSTPITSSSSSIVTSPSTTSSIALVEEAWKSKVKNAKLVQLDHQTLALTENIPFPSQQFNMADEKIGEVKSELGQGWSIRAYNRAYSAVGYVLPTDVLTDNYGRVIDNRANNYMADVVGARTEVLPTGSAHYEGISFGANSEGKLKLSIDFSNNTVSGSVTDRKLLTTKESLADISLKEANISAVGEHHFSGIAESQGVQGSYYGSFFGPNAEEVGGIIRDDLGNKYEGFSGTK